MTNNYFLNTSILWSFHDKLPVYKLHCIFKIPVSNYKFQARVIFGMLKGLLRNSIISNQILNLYSFQINIFLLNFILKR